MSITALHSGTEAMEYKPKSELKVVLENSFTITDYETRLHSEKFFLWRYGIGDTYKWYGKQNNVSIETLRGDNFQPREFWSQPFEKILHTLYPLIRKHNIFYIANFDTDDICFYPPEEPHYEFINEIPHQFPEIVEYYFEEDVWREINEWMDKQGLKRVEWEAYQESIHNHYGTKEPLKVHDPKARKLPLYEYFLPCLS